MPVPPSTRPAATWARLARRARRPQVALLVLLILLVAGYVVRAVEHRAPAQDRATVSSTPLDSSLHAVALSVLPGQAQHTVALIRAGGPFPYPRDGVVFRNAEHRLPAHASGYYHEYTVPTPGKSDRGARRIIVGIGGEYFYTADHYETFVRVDVGR